MNIRTSYSACLFLAGTLFVISSQSAAGQKTTLLDRSRRSPAMTEHAGSVLLAWTGRDGRINILKSAGGNSWSGAKVTLAEKTDRGIALASDGEYAYLAWKGTDYLGSLNIMRSRDGETWSDKVSVDESSDLGPALAVLRGRVFLAWRGKANHRLNIMQSSDGFSWRTKVVLDDTTMARPALAANSGRLFLTWTEKPYLAPMPDSVRKNVTLPAGPIRLRRSRDGIDWGSSVRIDGQSKLSPVLTSLDDRLFLAWTSTDRGHLMLTRSDDGIDWTSKIRLRESSGRAPALSAANGALAIAWTGSGNQQLNIDIQDRGSLGVSTSGGRGASTLGRTAPKGSFIPVGLFLGSPEEGARMLSAVRLLPRDHRDSRGEQFPLVSTFSKDEVDALLLLGDAAGFDFGPTLDQFPLEPLNNWRYRDFRPPPVSDLEIAKRIFLDSSDAPFHGLVAAAFHDGNPVCFLVDTRSLSLRARDMRRPNELGLDIRRSRFLDGLDRVATAAHVGRRGDFVVVYE